MTTILCDRLNIALPVIQAAMGGAAGPRLAAAVSEAGGLGMLALWRFEPEAVRDNIRQTRKLTDRPFGVNLNLEWPQEERLAICLDEGVPVISFFWGEPGRALIDQAHEGGAIVMHSSASAAEARQVVDQGADIIVAQGWEAGGHVRGTVSTMALVPAVVDAVNPVPVVAAGGIADSRGFAAAMALGASGVWIGTRLLASNEADIHPRYLERLLESSENDTYYSQLFNVGWPNAPHRTLRNSTIDNWEAAGRPEMGSRPGEGEVVAKSTTRGDVVRYQSSSANPDTAGDIDALSLWAGQSVGLVSECKPAGDIIREMISGADSLLSTLAGQSD